MIITDQAYKDRP